MNDDKIVEACEAVSTEVERKKYTRLAVRFAIPTVIFALIGMSGGYTYPVGLTIMFLYLAGSVGTLRNTYKMLKAWEKRDELMPYDDAVKFLTE